MAAINIVLCADENYAPYCAVAILTAIIHSKNPADLHFYILTPGLKEETVQSLHGMVASRKASLTVLGVENALPDDMALGRFGIGTVIRLYMHRYLPADCKRVIYLDCDLLVLDDIASLWDMELAGRAVGGVSDLCLPSAYARLTKNGPYFNAGVLLVDLSLWRQHNIGERALSYLQDNVQSLRYLDQDALNHVLSGQWLGLDLSWNFQPTAYRALERNYYYLDGRRSELEQAVKQPRIVHFIGNHKPWHATCTHPLQHLFVKFSSCTPWPIDKASLVSTLPLVERLRIAFKAVKLWRRRRRLVYRLPDLIVPPARIEG